MGAQLDEFVRNTVIVSFEHGAALQSDLSRHVQGFDEPDESPTWGIEEPDEPEI